MESLVGIPGTISPEAGRIRWRRIADQRAGRTYEADVSDGTLVAIVSRDDPGTGPLWHISVSHRHRDGVPRRCPSWDEIKHAKYQLIPENVCMVLIFPRRGVAYVDIAPTCLHLWETKENLDE